jgi:hypothetical protein
VVSGTVAALLALVVGTPTAAASGLIARNAHHVRLAVSRNGHVALLSFRAEGRRQRVRAWGAIDARSPSETTPQVRFKLDYSGGRPFRRRCRPYDGPTLQHIVAACKAPDGSYWAAQQWTRLVRVGERSGTGASELHLSHWRGDLAQLEVKLDWVDWSRSRYDDLYGRLTYHGLPVHGFRSTHRGAPLDTYGRNLYIDTLDSAYGAGWRRENGVLTHRPTGGFCYGLARGQGSAYRVSVVGPGVTPDVFWQADAPGPYDQARDLQAGVEQRALVGKRC